MTDNQTGGGLPSRRRMLLRAFTRRCPACGGGPLFSRWIKVAKQCPQCGLRLTRGEEGYALGAIWFNLIAAEAVGTTLWVGTLIATWPSPPWELLHWLGPVVAITMPFLFYPFARTLFLAFDLCFRPLEAADRDHAVPLRA